MNKLQLSTDLNVITAEINSYKQVAGQAIFEIGRRLKHVKENDLVHGEWIDWLETIDFTPRHAQRFIKVTEEIGVNTTSMSHLGIAVMYEIATLPLEEREKEHQLDSGETKTPNEMTTRELQEVKRQLRKAQESEQIAIKQLEEEQLKEPEKIEVVPDDYDYIKGNFEEAQKMRDRYKKQLEEMREELNNSSDKRMVDDSELKSLERREETLKNKINSYEKIFDMQSNIEMVLSTIQTKIHTFNTNDIKKEFGIIDEFDSTLNEVINVCNELKNKLPDKNIVEGEIVND